MIVFLDRLSMWSMPSCTEQVQIQKYKTHAYKTPKTACLGTTSGVGGGRMENIAEVLVWLIPNYKHAARASEVKC